MPGQLEGRGLPVQAEIDKAQVEDLHLCTVALNTYLLVSSSMVARSVAASAQVSFKVGMSIDNEITLALDNVARKELNVPPLASRVVKTRGPAASYVDVLPGALDEAERFDAA